MLFKSKLSTHRHRGGNGYEYACPLTLETESCQSITYQDNFLCNFVISKGELIEKVLPLGLEGVHSLDIDVALVSETKLPT